MNDRFIVLPADLSGLPRMYAVWDCANKCQEGQLYSSESLAKSKAALFNLAVQMGSKSDE